MKSKREERVNMPDISKAINSPSAFTAKILKELVKGNILKSTRGPHGGFEISEEKRRTTKLVEIIKAIDSDAIYNRCGLGLSECNEITPCPLHGKFKFVRDDLKTMLDNTTLEDLASQLENGTAFLKL